MKYRKEIDGLRALAVLPVILFHAGIPALGGGYIGVDVFFVISGFLITSIIFEEKEAGRFSLLLFYERRVRRILPALFVIMAACMPLAWLWLLPGDMRSFSQSLIAVSALVPNFLFYRSSGYFETATELKPLLHTWSLGVEEQYYLFFPVLILLLWKFGKWRIWWFLALIALVSLFLAQWISGVSQALSFYMLPTRGWEILMGALVAIYMRNRHGISQVSVGRRHWSCEALSGLGILLIIYSIFAFDKQTPVPGLYTLIPTIGAALLLAYATQSTITGRVLANRMLVGIGVISYSLYLWHQPLLAFARHRSGESLSNAMIAAILSATLILAYLTWRFVEVPFRDKRRINRKPLMLSAAVFTIFFISSGSAGILGKGFPDRVPESVRQSTADTERDARLRDDGGCNVHKNDFAPPRCIKGAQSVEPRFVLLGDSHAAVLAYELGRAFEQAGMSFVQKTKNSCPFAIGLTMSSPNNCDKYQAAYLNEFGAKQAADTYIVASRWSYYAWSGDAYMGGGESSSRRRFSAGRVPLDAPVEERGNSIIQAYVESVQLLLQMGQRVILVYPIPAQRRDVPRQRAMGLWFEGGGAPDISTEYSYVAQQDSAVMKAFDEIGVHENLVRIRPDRMFCNTFVANGCAGTEEGRLLYIDDNHLSNYGTRYLIDEIMRHIAKRPHNLDS